MHVIHQRPTHFLEKEQASVQRTPFPGQLNFHPFSHCVQLSCLQERKRAMRRANSWNFSSFNLLFANAALSLVSGKDSSVSRTTHQKILSIFYQTCFPPRMYGRQVTKTIASSKVITLANRNFEVNQSLLYDSTMDFKCM